MDIKNKESKIGFGPDRKLTWGRPSILKVGVCRAGLDRIEENTKREEKDRFVDVWEKIELYGKVTVESKKLALHYEKKLLEALGPKQFWIKEKPSGLTEMRVWTKDRKDVVDFFIKEFS